MDCSFCSLRVEKLENAFKRVSIAYPFSTARLTPGVSAISKKELIRGFWLGDVRWDVKVQQ